MSSNREQKKNKEDLAAGKIPRCPLPFYVVGPPPLMMQCYGFSNLDISENIPFAEMRTSLHTKINKADDELIEIS